MNKRINPDLKLRFKSLTLLDYSIQTNLLSTPKLSVAFLSVGESLSHFNPELDYCVELENQNDKRIILKIETKFPNEIIDFLELSVIETETVSIAFSENTMEISHHNGADGEEGWGGIYIFGDLNYNSLIILSELNKEFKFNNYSVYEIFHDCEKALNKLSQYFKREYFTSLMRPMGPEMLKLHLREIKLCNSEKLHSLKYFLESQVLNLKSDLNKNLIKHENIDEVYDLTNDLIKKIDRITAHNSSLAKWRVQC